MAPNTSRSSWSSAAKSEDVNVRTTKRDLHGLRVICDHPAARVCRPRERAAERRRPFGKLADAAAWRSRDAGYWFGPPRVGVAVVANAPLASGRRAKLAAAGASPSSQSTLSSSVSPALAA